MEQGKQQMQSGEQSDEIAADAHEHGKKMDVAQLQKDNAEKERSLLSLTESVLRSIEKEVTGMRATG